MAEKRYHFIIVEEELVKNPIITKILRSPMGSQTFMIYLMLLLQTMNTKGIIRIDPIYESLAEQVSCMSPFNSSECSAALGILKACNLLEELNNGDNCIQVLLIENVFRIGSECESAVRTRQYRLNKKRNKQLCDGSVTERDGSVTVM